MKLTRGKYAAYALIALLAQASAVTAQELIFSMKASDACLLKITKRSERLACIGYSANLCLEATSGGYTRLGALGCYEAELAQWESRLAHSYKHAQAGDPTEAEGWHVFHQSFLRDRDETCQSKGAENSAGSPLEEEMHVVAWCKLQMTGQHALVMREMVQGQ